MADSVHGAADEDVARAMDDARRAATASTPERLIEGFIDRMGARASVTAVFGEPIERDGLTVVPVARIRWVFGGGAGGGRGPDGTPGESVSGAGAGGGISAEPVGYVEIGDGRARFRAIAGLPSPVFILASGLTAVMVFRAIGRIVAMQPRREP